jgi:GAF domain-containing protein
MDPARTIPAMLNHSGSRVEKAAKLAEMIRHSRPYRWVGVYDVGPEQVSILAFSGPSAPAYPQFPITKGLTGSAIREKRTIVAGDVGSDSRYLTAFGSTLSEIIIPVVDETSGVVVGTIDVESEQKNAFSADDQALLEECARLARPLWSQQ